MSTLAIVLLIISIIFLTTLLVLVNKFPNPTAQQFLVFRVILALTAAGIGAIIPGFIDVNGTLQQIAFRAGGALVLFLVVYLVNPGIAQRMNIIKGIK